MKLSWRLATESKSLWAKVVRMKYCRDHSVDGQASNAWQGIMDNIHLTKEGIGHAIGDERRTKFWTHKWIDGTTLLSQVTSDVPEEQKHRMIHEYWIPNVGWDWSQFSQYLPLTSFQIIASFELDQEGVSDSLYWVAHKSGKFSIKSVLTIVRGEHITQPISNWHWVWRTNVPQRIHLFTWLVMHNKLLTNAVRHDRHMSPHPGCSVCGADTEDLDHIFRRCPQALQVWQLLQHKGIRPAGSQLEIRDRFKLNATTSQNGPNWPIKFLLITLYLWK